MPISSAEMARFTHVALHDIIHKHGAATLSSIGNVGIARVAASLSDVASIVIMRVRLQKHRRFQALVERIRRQKSPF